MPQELGQKWADRATGVALTIEKKKKRIETGRQDFADFALRPLGFSEINPRSTIFAVRSKIRKIFTKRYLASEKSTKIAPKLQKFISFQPQLQIQ
jgi:hypothetical protein